MAKPPKTLTSTCVAVVLVGAVIRCLLAYTDQGVFWPDEVFQSMEPAHRLVFGYGFRAWEFQNGARSWLFPFLLSLVWWPLKWLHLDNGMTVILAAKFSMVALGTWTIVGAARLANVLHGRRAAVIAATLAAFHPLSLVYGHRCMAELASSGFVIWATLSMVGERPVRSAILMGIAFVLRYQSGLWALPLAMLILRRSNWKALGSYSLAIGAVVCAGGVLDWCTCGSPFHSLIYYLRSNMYGAGASYYGTAPLGFYFQKLGTSGGWAMAFVVVGFLVGLWRHKVLGIGVFGFVAIHSLIAHKELRFLLPVVPVWLSLSAVGIAELVRVAAPSYQRRLCALWGTCGVFIAAFLWRTTNLSFADLGQYEGTQKGRASAFHDMEPYNRLLWRAGGLPDLCGLALGDTDPRGTGGYAYLHRDVPVYLVQRTRDGHLLRELYANYQLLKVGKQIEPEFEIVDSIGSVGLYRRPGGCIKPPFEVHDLRK